MSSQILKHYTNRLFYRKFAYKISVKSFEFKYEKELNIDNFIDNHPKDKIKSRTEFRKTSIFTSDKDIYDKLLFTYQRFILETWEPKNLQDLEVLENNNRIILVDKLPFNNYSFKVYFHHMKIERLQILSSWLDKYPKSMYKVSKQNFQYIQLQKRWSWNPYILIADSKMLIMLKLVMSNDIKKVEEYVLRESINTVLED